MRKKLLGLLIIGFIGLNCISTIIAVTADAQTTSGTLSPGDYSYVDVGVNAGDVVRVTVTSDYPVTVWLCTSDEYSSGSFLLGSYEQEQQDTMNYQYTFTSSDTYDMFIVMHNSVLSSSDADVQVSYSSYPPFEDFIVQNIALVVIIGIALIVLCCVGICRRRRVIVPPPVYVPQQPYQPVPQQPYQPVPQQPYQPVPQQPYQPVPQQPYQPAKPIPGNQRFCSNCGKEVGPGLKFCGNCGYPM